MTDKLKFAAEVLVVFAAVYLLQKKLFKLPVVGEFLPGGN